MHGVLAAEHACSAADKCSGMQASHVSREQHASVAVFADTGNGKALRLVRMQTT